MLCSAISQLNYPRGVCAKPSTANHPRLLLITQSQGDSPLNPGEHYVFSDNVTVIGRCKGLTLDRGEGLVIMKVGFVEESR